MRIYILSTTCFTVRGVVVVVVVVGGVVRGSVDFLPSWLIYPFMISHKRTYGSKIYICVDTSIINIFKYQSHQYY